MIAAQGVYDNGRIQLSENAPVEKANVIVVFPEAEKIEKTDERGSSQKAV